MRISASIPESLDLKDTITKSALVLPLLGALRGGQKESVTLTLMRLRPWLGQAWTSVGTLIFHFSNGMFGFGCSRWMFGGMMPRSRM